MSKFPKEQRTFETRLLFINEMFSDLHDKTEIMTSCIQYKLGKSLEQYLRELKLGALEVEHLSPLTVMRRIDKKE